MSDYWLTFRIAEDAQSDDRRQDIYDLVQSLIKDNRDMWVEPTSFIAFKCPHGIDDIKNRIEAVIDSRTDVVLLAKIGYKAYRLIGRCEDKDVLRMFPDLE